MANPLADIYNQPINQLNIQILEGNWEKGYALDLHTTSSSPIIDENTNVIIGWKTIRPDIAERLYRLKYAKDIRWIKSIAVAASNFLQQQLNEWKLDLIMPVPPSDLNRTFQPVIELANNIGEILNIKVDNKTLKKKRQTQELKSENDPEKRGELIKGAFDVESDVFKGKNILLFDDLYRSGVTLSEISNVLKDKGKCSKIFILTITKTRTKR